MGYIIFFAFLLRPPPPPPSPQSPQPIHTSSRLCLGAKRTRETDYRPTTHPFHTRVRTYLPTTPLFPATQVHDKLVESRGKLDKMQQQVVSSEPDAHMRAHSLVTELYISFSRLRAGDYTGKEQADTMKVARKVFEMALDFKENVSWRVG